MMRKALAPGADGGAYSAPPYPLAAIVPLPSLKIHYGHPPHSIPVSAPEYFSKALGFEFYDLIKLALVEYENGGGGGGGKGEGFEIQ